MAEGEQDAGLPFVQPAAEARPAAAGPPDVAYTGGTAAAAGGAACPAGPQAVDAADGCDTRQQDGGSAQHDDAPKPAVGSGASSKSRDGSSEGAKVRYRQVRRLVSNLGQLLAHEPYHTVWRLHRRGVSAVRRCARGIPAKSIAQPHVPFAVRCPV